ncbi:MAG: M48 family metallopeptidase [Ruminococcus sp.]|nr:M48 family metallopeptidase [Ruminococcus sp.]
MNHSNEFVAILDAYMPNWGEIKQKLNSSILDYINSEV